MEEAPENGKESPHSVRANGLIRWFQYILICFNICVDTEVQAVFSVSAE